MALRTKDFTRENVLKVLALNAYMWREKYRYSTDSDSMSYLGRYTALYASMQQLGYSETEIRWAIQRAENIELKKAIPKKPRRLRREDGKRRRIDERNAVKELAVSNRKARTGRRENVDYSDFIY